MSDDEILLVLKRVEQLLDSDHSLKVGDLTLSLNQNKVIEVIGWSNFNHIENLTKKQSLHELAEIKDLFQRMRHSSKELSDFVGDKTIVYSLHFEFGKSGIGICSEMDGEVIWGTQLREA